MDASSPAEAGPSGVNANNQDESVHPFVANMNRTKEEADRQGREWAAQRQREEAMSQSIDFPMSLKRLMQDIEQDGAYSESELEQSFSDLFDLIRQERQGEETPQSEEPESEEAPRPQSEEAPQSQPADDIITEGDGDTAQQQPAGVTTIDEDGEVPPGQQELESGLEGLNLDPGVSFNISLESPQQGLEMMQAQQGMAPAKEQDAGVSATDTPVEQWLNGVRSQPEGSLYQQEIGTSGWPLGGHQAPLAAQPENTFARFQVQVGLQQGIQGMNAPEQTQGHPQQEPQPGHFNQGYQYGTDPGYGQFPVSNEHMGPPVSGFLDEATSNKLMYLKGQWSNVQPMGQDLATSLNGGVPCPAPAPMSPLVQGNNFVTGNYIYTNFNQHACALEGQSGFNQVFNAGPIPMSPQVQVNNSTNCFEGPNDFNLVPNATPPSMLPQDQSNTSSAGQTLVSGQEVSGQVPAAANPVTPVLSGKAKGKRKATGPATPASPASKRRTPSAPNTPKKPTAGAEAAAKTAEAKLCIRCKKRGCKGHLAHLADDIKEFFKSMWDEKTQWAQRPKKPSPIIDFATRLKEYNEKFDLKLSEAQARELFALLNLTANSLLTEGGVESLGRFLNVRDALYNTTTGAGLLRNLELLLLDAANPKSFLYDKKPGE